MEYYSSHINKLIEQFSHLPGIGAKSAQRLAFHIMNMPKEQVQQLTNAITDARMNVQYCKCCYTLTDKEMCPICSNPKRDHSTIMVVENTRDLAAYEKTGKFDGVYHVLHGAISPMLGIGPDDIKLKELITRLEGDVEVQFTDPPEWGAEQIARDCAQRGEPVRIYACGGDGTLNEVISGLMRLDAPPPLGYLPQGTTNDFASSLQIPRTPASAAKNIVQNRMRELDIGRWNERSFIYVASFGAFTRSSYAASQAAKNALGHFAYILEGMKDLNTLRPYHIRLTADGEVLDGDYLFGAVCNSTSIGGLMKLDPERVVLDDGKFEMLLVPSPKTAADLQNLVLALLNQQYDSQGLVFRHVSSLRLETEEELPWSLDGEYAPSVPVVDIVNRQRALRMLL